MLSLCQALCQPKFFTLPQGSHTLQKSATLTCFVGPMLAMEFGGYRGLTLSR